MQRINLYDKVSVILTEKGAGIVNYYYHTQPTNNNEEKNKNYSVNLHANDKFEAPLYEIMNIFGPVLYKGCTPLIKDNFINLFES